MRQFEDEFMEVQSDLISLVLEAAGNIVDKVYAYCSIEEKNFKQSTNMGKYVRQKHKCHQVKYLWLGFPKKNEKCPIERIKAISCFAVDWGWIKASSLHAGMTIWFASGTNGTVEDIFNEGLKEPVTVYNFEVKDFHTYFVGDNGVLVHNTCKTNGDASVADVTTGQGYDTGDAPVRIEGEWTENDMKQVLLGHPPRGFGSYIGGIELGNRGQINFCLIGYIMIK